MFKGHMSDIKGHTSDINAIAFSPDGRTVISASYDCTIKLWDITTGANLRTFKGHRSYVEAVIFSPDGKKVASASNDYTVRLWDIATGAALQTFKGPMFKIGAIAFSPDSGTVISASDDCTVKLWDTVTGANLRTFKAQWTYNYIKTVAFSPDGGMVASASDDGTVRLWDTATGAALQTLEDCSIRQLAFSREGPYLETDRGLLYIQRDPASLTAPTKLQPLRTVFVRGDWITRNGSNILWLPSEYRPSCSVFRGNLLVLGLPSGKVTFIKFNDFSEI
jgi:WD40 repeat protein